MDRRRLIILTAALAAPGLIAAAPKDEKSKDEKPKDDKKDAKGGKDVTGSPTYLRFAPLNATVKKPNGRRGVLSVEVGLDVPDEKLRKKADSILPRLRASFVQSLQIYASGMTPGMAPNADVLVPILQRDTDRLLGQKGARLLLGTMMVN